jgi:hydroxymethylbilane synthase
MLPCVGQAAIGIETRQNDKRIAGLCAQLNDADTFRSITAERAFLRGMGGGCQLAGGSVRRSEWRQNQMRAVSFLSATSRRPKARDSDPEKAGEDLRREA